LKCRYYMLVTIAVKPTASLASLLARLEGKNWARIIDHDEITRRVHIAIGMDKWFLLEDLLRPYADTASIEFKAACWGRKEVINALTRAGRVVNITPRGEKQVVIMCRDGMILATLKNRQVNAKYCRRVLGPVTPSACTFYYPYDNIPTLSVKAINCFSELSDYVKELKKHT